MTQQEKIKKTLRQHKEELKDKFKLKGIGIFGSYRRGQQNKKSDLDILVEFKEAPGLLEFIAIERYLSKLLEKKVDLVMKAALKPRIGKHILEEVVYI